jgi:hypothetical protein
MQIVRNVFNSAYSTVAEKLPTRKSFSVEKITSVAAEAFAIYAATSLPIAEAGFGFFTVCMGICTTATGGFGVMACVQACVATLAAPTP